MNIFGKTLIPLFLATGMLVSCSSFLATPTLSQADKMETAISTASPAYTLLITFSGTIQYATALYTDQNGLACSTVNRRSYLIVNTSP